MNRYLTIPLVASMFVFVAVLHSNSSTGEPPRTKGQTLTSASSSYTRYETKPELIDAKQAETLVLDQWPVSETRFLSRAMPRTTLQADLHFAEHASEDSSFLATLFIRATLNVQKLEPNNLTFDNVTSDEMSMQGGMAINRPNTIFPVHIDRYERTVNIFAENQWQPYDQWRDQNLPKFKELTGFES